MDTGEVPGYEFEVPRGPRHRTRRDSLRGFPEDSPPTVQQDPRSYQQDTRSFQQDTLRLYPQDPRSFRQDPPRRSQQDPVRSFARDSAGTFQQDQAGPFMRDAMRPLPHDQAGPFTRDSVRPLRQAARAVPPPKPSVRDAGGGLLAIMRTKNWLVGLVLPILVAVIVGIAVVVTAGGGGTGGAAPSALAAGFPPARLAGAAFTGPAGASQVMLTAIAASAGTEVLAGTSDGGPALWVSKDGGAGWTRAAPAGPAALTKAGSGQFAGVAHGAAGWLAVGTTLAGAGAGTSGPLIASSPDARAWTVQGGAAALGAGSAEAVTAAVAASRKAFVIVGHRAAPAGGVKAAAWYAPGLTGWRTAKIASKAGQAQTLMSAVTATAGGFAAVGAAGMSPAAWLSADGGSWRRSELASPAGAARAALDYVAAHGAVVVAAGTAFSAAGTGSPFAEVSMDSGATWSLVSLPEPVGGRAGAVTALTAAGAGFTAAGTYGTRTGSGVVIWTLLPAGGSGWTAATPQGRGLAGQSPQNAITALAADGATLTGAGYTGQQTQQQPTLWQSPIRY